MKAICQRCGERENEWTVKEVEFHVRELKHWKVQLCERCAVQVEMHLKAILLPLALAPSPGQKECPDPLCEAAGEYGCRRCGKP